VITPSEGLIAFKGEAIINWVGVRGFEPPVASHLLLWPPMGFTQTKAITCIYVALRVEGRHSEAQMADAGWGSGRRDRPGASCKSVGGAEGTRIEAPVEIWGPICDFHANCYDYNCCSPQEVH